MRTTTERPEQRAVPAPGAGQTLKPPRVVTNGKPQQQAEAAVCERMLRASKVCAMGFGGDGRLIYHNEAAARWIKRYFEVSSRPV